MRRFFLSTIALLCALSLKADVLTLDSCLSSARQHNCTIQSALKDVQIAQEVKKQVFTKFFPQVNLTAFAFHALDPLVRVYIPGLMQTAEGKEALESIFESMKEDYPNVSKDLEMINYGGSAGASLIQPLFMGGRIVNGNKLAEVGIQAAEKQIEISERDVLQEVEDTYWLLAGLYEKRATVKRVNELLDTIQTVAQSAYNNGLVLQNDLLKVMLKKNEIETKSVQLENGILLASKLLCQLTGITYSGEPELEPFPDTDMQDSPVPAAAVVVTGRPEAELLAMNIKAEQLRKKLTIGEALPQVGIGLQGGYSNFFDRDRWNGLAFAFVRVPLTQWWETGHKIKEHNLRIEKAQMMQRDLMGKMTLQNEQAYSRMNEALRLVTQHQSAMTIAEDNYRICMLNYEAGIATMSDLLESQALLLQAQNAYTDARISYRGALRKFNSLNK